MNQTKGAEAGNDPTQATAPAAIILRTYYIRMDVSLKLNIHTFGCKVNTYLWMYDKKFSKAVKLWNFTITD